MRGCGAGIKVWLQVQADMAQTPTRIAGCRSGVGIAASAGDGGELGVSFCRNDPGIRHGFKLNLVYFWGAHDEH